MKNSGEIKIGTRMGKFLYNIAKNKKYKQYVETGTKYADGSTFCILKGLLERDDDSKLIGLETHKPFFNVAIKNLKDVPEKKVKILNKSLVSFSELPDWKTWNGVKKESYLYNKDIQHIEILDKIENIDVLLLDSGGWSRQSEWGKYKNDIKVIILDDTTGSTSKIRQEILSNLDKWKILVDNVGERNGWLAAEKIY